MEISEGTFYRTADGRPAIVTRESYNNPNAVSGYIFVDGQTEPCTWRTDGRVRRSNTPHPDDLIAEWSDPIPSPDPVALIREMREALNDSLYYVASYAADDGGLDECEITVRSDHDTITGLVAKADAYLAGVKPCD